MDNRDQSNNMFHFEDKQKSMEKDNDDILLLLLLIDRSIDFDHNDISEDNRRIHSIHNKHPQRHQVSKRKKKKKKNGFT